MAQPPPNFPPPPGMPPPGMPPPGMPPPPGETKIFRPIPYPADTMTSSMKALGVELDRCVNLDNQTFLPLCPHSNTLSLSVSIRCPYARGSSSRSPHAWDDPHRNPASRGPPAPSCVSSHRLNYCLFGHTSHRCSLINFAYILQRGTATTNVQVAGSHYSS